jgi:hypothetical protein
MKVCKYENLDDKHVPRCSNLRYNSLYSEEFIKYGKFCPFDPTEKDKCPMFEEFKIEGNKHG